MDTKTLVDAHLMNPLEERIGYKFRNSLLLAEALTHSSISLERKDYPFDNQRLEFLGDAVLQLVITEELFLRFPDFTEGQLTKIRTRLVSRTALKEHARHLRLGEHLMMGRGEETSGGRDRASTLGDSFEALVGGLSPLNQKRSTLRGNFRNCFRLWLRAHRFTNCWMRAVRSI